MVEKMDKYDEIIIDKEKIRPIDTPYICCDNSKVSKFFNGTDIIDTIKELYEYYRSK